jgi:hypothetical protein
MGGSDWAGIYPPLTKAVSYLKIVFSHRIYSVCGFLSLSKFAVDFLKRAKLCFNEEEFTRAMIWTQTQKEEVRLFFFPQIEVFLKIIIEG